MGCETVRPFLQAYGDNELSVESAVEVEQHLEECWQCRTALERARRFAETLSRLYPRAPLPPGLEERVGHAWRTPVRWRYRRGAFALAASILLVLVSWPLLRRSGPVMPSAVLGAAAVHREGLAHQLPLALQSSDPAAVNAWLRTALPFEIGQPVRATTADLTLQGAAVVEIANDRAGYVRYGRGAHTISLLLLRPREWVKAGELRRVGDTDFHFYSIDGLKLIAWNHPPLSYVLVSALGGRGVPACAVCHGGAQDPALREFGEDGVI